jgi:hypothetical protein
MTAVRINRAVSGAIALTRKDLSHARIAVVSLEATPLKSRRSRGRPAINSDAH